MLSRFLQSACSVTSTMYFACSPIVITEGDFCPSHGSSLLLLCSRFCPLPALGLHPFTSLPSPACQSLLFFAPSCFKMLNPSQARGAPGIAFPRLEKTVNSGSSFPCSPDNAGGRSTRISCCLPQARRVAKLLLLLSFMSLRISVL